MRIEQLIAFDKVVQHSSFTKAANELYTTQPSVSKMIDALEDELGHQLLRRTSRGIELTAYGKWVYGDVKIILQMVNGWQESTPLEEVPREVHIQSTTTMCNFLSAGFIPCLKDRHPTSICCSTNVGAARSFTKWRRTGSTSACSRSARKIRRTRPPPWSGSAKTAGTAAR